MQDNATVIRRFADEVITQGQIDSAAQFVWEDVVEQVPFPGQGPGLEGLKDVLRSMRTGFPDIVFAINEQVAEGDKVAARWTAKMTHLGDSLGIKATNRKVTLTGATIVTIKDGMISEGWNFMDMGGLIAKLQAE